MRKKDCTTINTKLGTKMNVFEWHNTSQSNIIPINIKKYRYYKPEIYYKIKNSENNIIPLLISTLI